MQASFNSYSTPDLFEKVGKKLGVQFDVNCQETRFDIPALAGEGEVSHFSFHDGLSSFIFNGKLRQDWQWEFAVDKHSPFYIFFPLSGQLEDLREDGEKFNLEPMQTLMVVQPGGSRRSIVFKAGDPIKVAILSIRKEVYLAQKGCGLEDLPEQLRLLMSMSDHEIMSLFPPDRTTLRTSILVQEILDCPYQGLMRNCFVEAKSRELLLLSLGRNNGDIIRREEIGFLKNIDFGKIVQAHKILVSDLKNAPTIEELSRQVGLNRQKLKVDFKNTFGKTIYQYLRKERMLAAKGLLMKKRMKIQAVAAEVGYENPSHFSRRFQEEFGILPSKFAAMIWREDQEN